MVADGHTLGCGGSEEEKDKRGSTSFESNVST